MERELIKSLIKWKASQSRKPLILKGVRQCGKTYLLKEFGARCYQDTAYFNFEENEALKTVFEKDYDIKRIIFELELQHGKKIQTENTLIIFAKMHRSITLYVQAHFSVSHYENSFPFRLARLIS